MLFCLYGSSSALAPVKPVLINLWREIEKKENQFICELKMNNCVNILCDVFDQDFSSCSIFVSHSLQVTKQTNILSLLFFIDKLSFGMFEQHQKT